MIAALIDEARREAKLTQREDDLAAPVRDYTEGLAALWQAQGALFVARIEPFRGRFHEAHSPIGDIWLNLWDEVRAETDPAFAEELNGASVDAMESGGEAAIAGLGLAVRFDIESQRVLDYLAKNAGEHIKNIDATTRETIRRIIEQAAKENLGYGELARRITAAFEYFGIGATQRHIDSRAHLVAVTELGNAYEEAGMIAGRQLKDSGFPMEKHWDTIGDDRVSDGCRTNQGAGWIEIDALWPSTEGTYDRQRPLRFPGCRCGQRIQISEVWRAAALRRFGAR